MAVTTLETMIANVRERSDMENTNFVSDAELTKRINESASELYDLLVRTNEDYYTITEEFHVSNGANEFDLTDLESEFYKLRGVDWSPDGGTTWMRVRPYQFLERDRYLTPRISSRYAPVRYRIVKKSLIFLPKDSAAGHYRVWFVPTFTALEDDADTFDGVNGWDEFITLKTALKCINKEESDTTALSQELGAVIDRITAMSTARDLSEPEKISDTRRHFRGTYSPYDYPEEY